MEKYDDLISRQMAIAEIKDYIVDPDKAVSEYEDNVFNYNAGLKSAVQAVVDLPSVQPEWKSGKWIYDGVKRICPFCKDFIVTGRSIVKYCWNCGARLKERSKDAES